MAKSDDDGPEIITAKWKTSLDAEEKYFGTVEDGEEFLVRFPILDLGGEIAAGTTVLWGRGSDLLRYTAVTLPFGPHGGTSSRGEQISHSQGTVSRLLIGDSYVG